MNELIQQLTNLAGSLKTDTGKNFFIPAIPKNLGYPEQAVKDLKKIFAVLPQVAAVFQKEYGGQGGSKVAVDAITKADIAITGIYQAVIAEHFSSDMNINEEEESKDVQNPPGLCVFDPIDGTKNFAEGNPNCCTVFSRFSVGPDDTIQQGFSLIFEPMNAVLTVGISGFGVVVFGREQVEKNKEVLRANLDSFGRRDLGRQVLWDILSQVDPKFEQIDFGSGSIELARVCAGEIDLHMRLKQKVWDFLPGAFCSYIIGKEVFFYTDGTAVFPYSLKQLRKVLRQAKDTSDRRMESIAVCDGVDLKEEIVSFAKIS